MSKREPRCGIDRTGRYIGVPYDEGHEIDSDELIDPGTAVEESEEIMADDEQEVPGPGNKKTTHVHQCDVCFKTFVSFKGLQQHAVVHTNQKPFVCDVCNKAFRFKSNLFEHRSLHNQSVLHECPFCGKTCRLKGNLKKHLRTHVTSKEELDIAWQPFSSSSNRRPSSDAAQDAIVIRDDGVDQTIFFPPKPIKIRKRKVGLGNSSKTWTDKIRRKELMPPIPIEEKMNILLEMIKQTEKGVQTPDDFMNQARAIPFERFDCPHCKFGFMSRMECLVHVECVHQVPREQRPLFCEICLRSFSDKKLIEQHKLFHERIKTMIKTGDLEVSSPGIVLPEEITASNNT